MFCITNVHAKAGHLGLGDIHCQSKDTKQSKRNKTKFSNEGDELAPRFVHSLVAGLPWGPCGVKRQ